VFCERNETDQGGTDRGCFRHPRVRQGDAGAARRRATRKGGKGGKGGKGNAAQHTALVANPATIAAHLEAQATALLSQAAAAAPVPAAASQARHMCAAFC
jgi:hypothetical protein